VLLIYQYLNTVSLICNYTYTTHCKVLDYIIRIVLPGSEINQHGLYTISLYYIQRMYYNHKQHFIDAKIRAGNYSMIQCITVNKTTITGIVFTNSAN